ncbi:MAG: hypothetical protein PHY06_05945 [Bacteroidales bacterium]|nr:hypothetical protein [Bacteroidales bacterium]
MNYEFIFRSKKIGFAFRKDISKVADAERSEEYVGFYRTINIFISKKEIFLHFKIFPSTLGKDGWGIYELQVL